MPTTVERTLYQAPGWRLGSFECRPEDGRWSRVNSIGDAAHVVFPRVPVEIAQLGREPVLATPNHAMVYNARQRFRRSLRAPGGDVSTFVALEPPALAALGEGIGVEGLGDERRLPFSHVPVDAPTYLAQHLLVRELDRAEPLAVEERVAAVLVRTVGPGFTAPRPRGRADDARRELVEDAKALLADDLGAPLTLDDLGRRLHVSPFHLARVFRARTGYSLHGYRRQLRLRASLDRLAEGAAVTETAFALGFASHSHFTDAFRSVFGVAPTAVRSPRRRGELAAATALPPS